MIRRRDRWLLLILSHHLALDHATLRDIVVEEARAHLLGESGALVAPAPFRGFVAQTRIGGQPSRARNLLPIDARRCD
ncbi:hypothetical protein [Methylocapsa aurea]|uniref:hypothetical protein n=1 Tax=Methylocapsa aurea TaxID=663610 RepID=UPI003D188656